MGKKDARPWPYSVGTRGINRVRVYDRTDAPNAIQIEWFDLIYTPKGIKRERNQQAMSTFFGAPIENNEEGRTLARDIADDLSASQGKKYQRAMRKKFRRRKAAEG